MRRTERGWTTGKAKHLYTAGRDLGVQIVSAALGGEAEELVDVEFDGGTFEVWWGLKDAVMQLLQETINR